MLHIDADSFLDLRMNTPAWVDDRAALCSASLQSFEPASGMLQFSTSCAGSGNSWNQMIIYKDWELLIPEEIRAENLTWDQVRAQVPEIVNYDLQVHCDCPAFTWHGPNYNLTVRDTSIYPNSVAPDPSRNTENQYNMKLQNVICKHLASVFNNFF